MTIRRWVVLLSFIAAWTTAVSHLPVLSGEITQSAAKVFLTAAATGEKPTSAPTTSPAAGPTFTAAPTSPPPAALPVEDHSAAAVPPTLEPADEKTASPNVLRPTKAQQEERVTPTLLGVANSAAGGSSRRAPTPAPLPTASPTQSALLQTPTSSLVESSTPQSLPTMSPTSTPTLAPMPTSTAAAPLLVAEKPSRPLELTPATPQPAVTSKVEATPPALTTPTQSLPSLNSPSLSSSPGLGSPGLVSPGLTAPSAAPALLSPEPSVAKSEIKIESPRVADTTLAAPLAKDEAPLGYDPATGKTYRNVLRSSTPTQALTPTPAPATTAVSPSTPAPVAAKPSGTAPTAASTPASTAPSTTVDSKTSPTAAPFASRPGTPPPGMLPTMKPTPSATGRSIPHNGPDHVVSDVPAASSPTTSGVRPNSLLTPGDEPPSQRAVVSKAPAQAESKKLFESVEEPVTITPEQEALRRRVQSTLATYYQNWTLSTRQHSPWEVMHAIIAYGVDTQLEHNGKPITAIGHLCFSGVCNKQAIVTVRNNRLYVQRGPGVQGHSGQFLAILAQSQLQRDYPLYAAGREYTLEDLIKAEQYDCESGTELTFKLIGLMHYLPSDAEWTNFQGQKWSLDRLVREEIVQPVRGAACGGTHRLMGLSYAIRKKEQRGEPIEGIYKEAQKYIDQYHKYTFGLQNPDGSFSTAWFVRRESRIDLDRRLQTTGHMLEWLCFSLSDEQLRDPRVTKSVKYVTDLLLDSQHEWEIGHLGHALHALQVYNERVYGGPIRSYEGLVSRRPIKTAQRQSAPTND